MMRILLCLGLAGCFAPKLTNGGLACAKTGKACPDGYYCAADTCWRDGTAPDLSVGDMQAYDLTGVTDLACSVDCAQVVLHASHALCTLAMCDYDSCAAGYADVDGNRTNGCESTLPTGVAEAASLQIWLKGDDYANGNWPDRSGNGYDAACSGGTCPGTDTQNGHTVVSFIGSQANPQYFTISHNANFFSSGSTVILAWEILQPIGFDAAYEKVLEFNDSMASTNRISFTRDGSHDWLDYSVCASGNCPCALFTNAWTPGGYHRSIMRQTAQYENILDQDASKFTNVPLCQANSPPLPTNAARTMNLIGWGHDTSTSSFNGKMAEIIVFSTALSDQSVGLIDDYLRRKYGL